MPARLVLDTNVWLDLLWFRDPRCGRLRDALDGGRVQVAMRGDCHAEWQRVLDYPALAIDAAARGRLLGEFARYCVDCVASQQGPRLPRCADPDDQKFVELARDAGACALLSRDAALLKLSRRLQRIGLCAVMAPEHWQPDRE